MMTTFNVVRTPHILYEVVGFPRFSQEGGGGGGGSYVKGRVGYSFIVNEN